MREKASKNWRKWRVSGARKESVSVPMTPGRGNLAEQPGPDGIRWGLVNRVRAEIAAGMYDTDEKMAVAEERLLAKWCS